MALEIQVPAWDRHTIVWGKPGNDITTIL